MQDFYLLGAWPVIFLSVLVLLIQLSILARRNDRIVLQSYDTTPLARAERLILEYQKAEESSTARQDWAQSARLRKTAAVFDAWSFLLSAFLVVWLIAYRQDSDQIASGRLYVQVSLIYHSTFSCF